MFYFQPLGWEWTAVKPALVNSSTFNLAPQKSQILQKAKTLPFPHITDTVSFSWTLGQETWLLNTRCMYKIQGTPLSWWCFVHLLTNIHDLCCMHSIKIDTTVKFKNTAISQHYFHWELQMWCWKPGPCIHKTFDSSRNLLLIYSTVMPFYMKHVSYRLSL